MVKEGTLIASLEANAPLTSHREEIQANVDAWARNLAQEIFVVDDNLKIIASNNANQGKSAIDILDSNIMLAALSGEAAESQSNITSQNLIIPVLNMAFPIHSSDGEIMGILYMRADMSSINVTIDKSKAIFIKAMIVAIAVTIILGFVISRSITEPIKDVTKKAERMARGDFSQEVSVKSDDEIGQLAEMFNYLRLQLDKNLSQISGEKNKLETVLKHMADGLIAVDFSGKIIHANHAAAKMLKATEEEIEKESYDTLIKELNPELSLRNLKERCEMEPGNEVFESGGNTYDIRYDRFKDEAGTDMGIIMIIQNITARTKLENMQMDFVANVSHELKTPLTTIKSYTETLLDGAMEDKETAEAFLHIVDTEADRMNRLVKDLLQLSRMENDQEKWNMKESNLISLLKIAVTKVQLTATAKNQHLNCIFNADERIAVIMDRDRIEQVILNILSNAIKYTKDGGRIDIDAVIIEESKEAHIIVRDNGIGIPESETSRVFERFFRVDKARSREMGGTGLGLSISKQIVEEHNGRIELESKEGKGTTVTITLPLAPSITRGQRNID